MEPAFVAGKIADLTDQGGSPRKEMDHLVENLVQEDTSQEELHTAFLDSLVPAPGQHDPIEVADKIEEHNEDIEDIGEGLEELEGHVAVDFDV